MVLEVQPQGLGYVDQEAILLLGFFPELLKAQGGGLFKLLVSVSAPTYLLFSLFRSFLCCPLLDPPCLFLEVGRENVCNGYNVLGMLKGSGMSHAYGCGCGHSSGCSDGSSGGCCTCTDGRLLSGRCCCGCGCGDRWLMRHVSCCGGGCCCPVVLSTRPCR